MNEAISIAKTGSNITVAGTSASAAIPTGASGSAPVYVRVASTTACYVKVGVTGLTAVAGDMLLSAGEGVVLNVGRATHIAALQVSAGGILQISPLEDS
jgi:hypothetical protein